MVAQWTGDVIGKMHIHGITAKELATRLDLKPEYISMILNGKREPKDAEMKIRAALDELIQERT